MAQARRPGETELPQGTRLLDRYSILDRVDSGGMATIYRAKDERLDRVVCIKLLRTTIVEGSGSTSGRAVYRATYSHFLQEALALSKLSHPNTLRIYDFGYLEGDGTGAQRADTGGAPFHVSEYLDGGNLEQHVRAQRSLEGPEVLDILEGITGAIAEAHEVGIIHRDIKPSNILFARVRGELVPKLADFGIAQSDLRKTGPQRNDEQSISTVALFSPRWAAPEQLCGSPEGPPTDVYALALVVTFMLTGHFLFADENVRETFDQRVRDDRLVRARLQAVADRLPGGADAPVRAVLEQALASRPTERLGTAPEFFHRLKEALTPEQVHAPEPASFFLPPPRPFAGAAPSQAPEATLEFRGLQGASAAAKPRPPAIPAAPRQVRLAPVHEKLDLSFPTPSGVEVRIRVTMLPIENATVHIKGLTCFVGKRGQRPSPALTIDRDGTVELVTANRAVVGELTCMFASETPGGWLFVVGGRQVLVPYSEARQAVALMLGTGQDIIVMCRRS